MQRAEGQWQSRCEGSVPDSFKSVRSGNLVRSVTFPLKVAATLYNVPLISESAKHKSQDGFPADATLAQIAVCLANACLFMFSVVTRYP